jgi:hypothetical protein
MVPAAGMIVMVHESLRRHHDAWLCAALPQMQYNTSWVRAIKACFSFHLFLEMPTKHAANKESTPSVSGTSPAKPIFDDWDELDYDAAYANHPQSVVGHHYAQYLETVGYNQNGSKGTPRICSRD